MDSLSLVEGGFLFDGLLGFPWSGCAAGMSPLVRGLRPSTGDHATFNANETIPAGYTREQGTLGCVYPRSPDQGLIETTGGGVTVGSNPLAGGAVWEWTHRGVQYVNDYDFGRQIQSALFSNGRENPTEAGSRHSSPNLPSHARQGSPMVSAETGPNAQSTRSAPLEWNPEPFGGSRDHPVMWRDMVLGKELTLNYAGLGAVVKYTTVLKLPQALPVQSGQVAELHLPDVYLRGRFRRFWTYQPGAKGAPEEVTNLVDCQEVGGYQFRPANAGGVLLSAGMSGRSDAMGLYGARPSSGGPIASLRLYNYLSDDFSTCHSQQTGQYAASTSAMSAVSDSNQAGTFPAGMSRYNVWIMSGTRDAVIAAMDSLHAMGVH